MGRSGEDAAGRQNREPAVPPQWQQEGSGSYRPPRYQDPRQRPWPQEPQAYPRPQYRTPGPQFTPSAPQSAPPQRGREQPGWRQYPSQPQYLPQGPQYPPRAGYQPDPRYAPQQQYPPGAARPRRRHTAGKVIGGIAGLAVVIITVAVIANGGGHSVQTAGTASSGARTETAGIGSAITLSGYSSGEQMSVAVMKVISSAAENDGLSLTPPRDRLCAVQFRLDNTGTAAYSDAPSNGAAVVDSSGQSYQSGLETVAGCTSFPATENIAPGNSGLGCIVFEVAESAQITQVQFTLDSGMGPQTGQWNIG